MSYQSERLPCIKLRDDSSRDGPIEIVIRMDEGIRAWYLVKVSTYTNDHQMPPMYRDEADYYNHHMSSYTIGRDFLRAHGEVE